MLLAWLTPQLAASRLRIIDEPPELQNQILFCFKTEPGSVVVAVLELTEIQLPLPPSAGIKGVCHHTCLAQQNS